MLTGERPCNRPNAKVPAKVEGATYFTNQNNVFPKRLHVQSPCPVGSEGRVLVVDSPEATPALRIHLIVIVPLACAGWCCQVAAAPPATGQLFWRGHQVEYLLHRGAAAKVIGWEPGAAGGRQLDKAELGAAAVDRWGEWNWAAGTCWGGEEEVVSVACSLH